MASPAVIKSYWPSKIVVIVVLAVLYFLSRQPTLSDPDQRELAEAFQFERIGLPEHEKIKNGSAKNNNRGRNLHPSIDHIPAWMSFVGAAAGLSDLDGDGLPNDVVYVDSRVDEVMVAPAPTTAERFPVFTLNPSPLDYDPETMAPMGSLIADFNEDGSMDILVYYWGRSPVIFLRDPATTSVAAKAYEPMELVTPKQRWFTNAATQADLDADGHPDLIIGNYCPDNANVLDTKNSVREEMIDSVSRALNGGTSRLFLWNKQAALSAQVPLVEAEDVLKTDIARGWTFAIGAADLNGDMKPEIYLVQDFGPDRLLHNRTQEPGKLEFALLNGKRGLATARSKVVGQDSFMGMEIDFADMNGDGKLDFFVSNVTCEFGVQQSNFFFQSTSRSKDMEDGIAPFRDNSEKLGVSRSGWGWEVRLVDLNNDGRHEIIQATGFSKGDRNKSRWPELHEIVLQNDQLIKNPNSYHKLPSSFDVSGWEYTPFFVWHKDDQRYYDVGTKVKGLHAEDPMLSRGIAVADVDGDGLLDIVFANHFERSIFLKNSSTNPGAFLGLHLRIPVGEHRVRQTVALSGHPGKEHATRPAIGATAEVTIDGDKYFAEVDGGGGHSGQRAPDLHFGLGDLDRSRTVNVKIRWLSETGVQTETLVLEPGWHTVILGSSK